MSKLKISEEDKVHEEWYNKSDSMTLKELPEFHRHLMEDYEHDYGTICHALASGAIATMWAMNKEPQGGITGFQAGAVMWQLIRGWNFKHNKTGMKLVDYDDLLYPQYEEKFEKIISKDTWEALQKEAKERIAGGSGSEEVQQHWQSIVDGKIPFGYRLPKVTVRE